MYIKENFDDDNSEIVACTPSRSIISFSSSTRRAKENNENSNTLLIFQLKPSRALHGITDISNNLGNK